MGEGVNGVLFCIREVSVKYVLFAEIGWSGVGVSREGVGCVPDDRSESKSDETRDVVGGDG